MGPEGKNVWIAAAKRHNESIRVEDAPQKPKSKYWYFCEELNPRFTNIHNPATNLPYTDEEKNARIKYMWKQMKNVESGSPFVDKWNADWDKYEEWRKAKKRKNNLEDQKPSKQTKLNKHRLTSLLTSHDEDVD